ncbi:MAG: PAS domain S-box protein [Deltaproteobacteria bacterium]|nr:PAS domain S-box protein [Deltaproteobacteria bacterium]
MIKDKIKCLPLMELEKEHKMADEALLESEEKYRLLAENTLDCIWKMDKNLKFTYINQSIFSMLGFKPKEWIGSSLSEHCSKEEMQKVMDLIAEEMKKRSYNTTLEMFLIHKDGREIPVEIRSKMLIDNDKNLIEFQGTTHDITERRQAEEEIRKLSSAVEQSIDGIAMANLEPRLTYVNNAFASMHGCFPEEMIGMKGVNLVKKEELDKFISSLNKIKTLGSWTGEIEHIRKDGTPFPAFLSVNLLKDAKGRPTGILAVVKDISEQKKLEAQFHQAQKMEAIGVLAGGVAHDFNNILTIIIGNADMALMNIDKDNPLREKLGEIKIAGERAASLTRQLLTFSRKQIITPRVLDLNELLTDLEKMLGRLVGEDIELLTIPEPALWPVDVDPGQMEQVIMNLAVNARDAMPTGGNLTIETANIDPDENYFYKHGIEEKKPGHYVILAVSDTGSGMDEKIKEHIFDPFFTTKEVGRGTGLGLSTVYGIVKQNNGFVWVYSEPGQGTTFKVYLPRVKENVEPEEKGQTPVNNSGGSETVLIVEDDDSLRKLAQNVLQQHGYKVLDAENGEDALRVSQAHEGAIHLMIADVVMPRMGGKKVAERLKLLYPRMKVIYMSGYTDNAIVLHGVLAPGLNFLQKPFSPEGLAHKVREVLDEGDKPYE